MTRNEVVLKEIRKYCVTCPDNSGQKTLPCSTAVSTSPQRAGKTMPQGKVKLPGQTGNHIYPEAKLTTFTLPEFY